MEKGLFVRASKDVELDLEKIELYCAMLENARRSNDAWEIASVENGIRQWTSALIKDAFTLRIEVFRKYDIKL